MAENLVFWDSAQPSNQQKESPQTFTIQQYSLAITSCTMQMDLSFPSFKLSDIKFLPSTSETKTGGVAAISLREKLIMVSKCYEFGLIRVEL